MISAGYNVITCTLEGMSLGSQLAFFETADIIIAQHGAALVNLIWSRAGIDVIEILPRDSLAGQHCLRSLAHCLGQNHHIVDQETAHSEVDPVRLLNELKHITTGLALRTPLTAE
jgi:capsular polysaccharide biosynthesis protein